MDQLIGYLVDAARWLVIFILAFFYPESYSAWQGRVIEMVRADEFKVVRTTGIRRGETVNVRLYGIDSPLVIRQQPFGKEAEAYAARRVLGRVVSVQPLPGLVKGSWYIPTKFVPRDDFHWEGKVDQRYHRVIALVYVDGVNIGEDYLANGIAWWYEPFVPFELGYKHLQDEAQEARKGLWALPDPVPPWKWQKTPLVEVNPWQHQTRVAYAVVAVLILIMLGVLLVVLAKRFLRLLRPREHSQNAADSHR